MGAYTTIRTIDDLTPTARALLCALLAESARDELAADPGAKIRSEKGTFRNLTPDERCHLECAAAGDLGARRAIRAVFALPLERWAAGERQRVPRRDGTWPSDRR